MKEIKVNSTLVIVVTTLIFLFAGHFIYQSEFIKKPLCAALQSIPNVSLNHVILQPKNAHIIIGTTSAFSLKEYPVVLNKIQHIVGNRKIKVQILDHPDTILQTSWQKMIFAVQEGMAHRRFTQVNETVNAIAKANNINSLVIMDDNYLFIELRYKNNYLLKVFSLDKIKNEVQNND